MAAIKRRVGGGTFWFEELLSTGLYDVKREIGECSDVNFKVDASTTDAMNHDGAIPVVSDTAVTDMKATLSFKTNNFDTPNMAMALYGTAATETFAIGATLPDGTVAAVETIVPVVTGADKPLLKGRLTFMSNQAVGDKMPVLVIPIAAVSSTGDIAYISKDFGQLSFEGKVLKHDTDGYFKEYLMAK